MLSASRTASNALLVCSPPMICSRAPGDGKFFRRLLHAVFAEQHLPGGKRGQHRLTRLGFRHRDQRHRSRVAPGLQGGGGDAGADAGQVFGDHVRMRRNCLHGDH